ncbi:acetylornithine transaminase [Peribacillus asahii]|uniref:Acetylornithine aminotransferase n=1 Tax=Peribacillus asahii TaxID=228899 RepID=A0A3T0KMP7_9BACI|nr:acetylornithine transaminase [Peribacillus asahii]AZV41679.1 acetylornithine aminotransferase [Peribacillus asahii]USK86025.1 acetylornithine transaminase [Peribacillus asahii]
MSSLFPTYARWGIEPEKAKGSWLISTEGTQYLDFTSGIAVLNLGHGHEKVKSAVANQLEKYWHVSNMFKSSAQERTAKVLTDVTGLGRVFFSNSGAEANEGAIKLARKATGKSKVVTCLQSFHGRTFATMAATGQEKVRVGFGEMLSTFDYVPYNDCEALAKAVDSETAAVMLEVVQGEGGIHVVEQAFLDAIKEQCEKHGALLIIDEIQTGIGRTGKPFAFQHFDVKPDIITAAKGLGNGLPIGAVIGKEELAEYFGPGSHGSTFGGNPVCIAAAEAVVNEIFTLEFLQETNEKAHYLMSELTKGLQGNKQVVEVRGLGMLIGIELTHEAQSTLEALQQDGLLVLTAGPNVLRLLPALTVSKEEIDLAVEKISKVLSV